MVDDKPMPKTEEEWKEELTPEQYHVLRGKGTEAPGSGDYLQEKRKGMYACCILWEIHPLAGAMDEPQSEAR